MSLPKILLGDCCPNSTGSDSGTEVHPENNEHNHDSLYYQKDEAHCQGARRLGRIVGTCPDGVCPSGSTFAGLAIASEPDLEDITLSIVADEDPGPGPYSAPTVTSVVVSDSSVTVTWGPSNNGASIGLKAIKDAIAADDEARALIEIVVCNCNQFVDFTPETVEIRSFVPEADQDGEGRIRKDGSWVTIFTDDIQDVVDDAIPKADWGKALKTNPETGLLSILALTVAGTVTADTINASIGGITTLTATTVNTDDLNVSADAVINVAKITDLNTNAFDLFNGAFASIRKHVVSSLATDTRTAAIQDKSGQIYVTQEGDGTIPYADLKIADSEIPVAKLNTFPGPYADDADAATGLDVAVGELYRVTGGGVAWRQA